MIVIFNKFKILRIEITVNTRNLGQQAELVNLNGYRKDHVKTRKRPQTSYNGSK